MPLKDGLSALREIRSEQRYSHVPVFMLSTSSRPADMDECRELGCSEYYIKPFRLAEYNSIISDMLHRTFHEID
jgi:CheY-like chemotaxis protein